MAQSRQSDGASLFDYRLATANGYRPTVAGQRSVFEGQDVALLVRPEMIRLHALDASEQPKLTGNRIRDDLSRVCRALSVQTAGPGTDG